MLSIGSPIPFPKLVPVLPLLLLAPPSTGAPADIPLDAHGLPQWEARIYDDFPVRIELESAEALAMLLERVPIASFSREQVRPVPGADGTVRVVFEPRVTDAESVALHRAGYAFERLDDVEQRVRREMEATWRRQAEEGGAALRAGERGVYHTYTQIGTILAQAETSYPAIADAFSVGPSVLGRELWTIKISDNVGTEEAEPEVRLAGTMHGNEPPAQEMLLYLVDHLTTQYGTDPDVTYLVDHYEIFITPCLNPDGLTAGTRWNSRGIDLNRNYPVPDGTIGDDGTWTEEAETVAVKNAGSAQNFVVSLNGHSGALVVNYPWDYTFALTPDDAAVQLLSLEYSTYNLPMYNSPIFPHGIVRGAVWYVTKGCLQDWSYQETGCVDVTLELSNTKIPPASQLDALWEYNRESFLHYVRAARYGINGVVTDALTGEPLAATVTVVGNAKPVVTDPDHGDYYKLLSTGTYDLVFSADGYFDRTVTGISTTWGTPTVLDVQLYDTDETGVGPAVVASGALTCWPNPFRLATTLRFDTVQGGRVRLAVHDVSGRLVRPLLDEVRPAGPVRVVWDGRGVHGETVANGIYFVRLEAGPRRETEKITLVR